MILSKPQVETILKSLYALDLVGMMSFECHLGWARITENSNGQISVNSEVDPRYERFHNRAQFIKSYGLE